MAEASVEMIRRVEVWLRQLLPHVTDQKMKLLAPQVAQELKDRGSRLFQN